MHGGAAATSAARPSPPTRASPARRAQFFEQNFRPVRISPLGTPDGFLTGYYEPIVEGVREQTDGYDYPLYRKPPNLLPGGRMAVRRRRREPPARRKRASAATWLAFYDRAAIDDGVLAGRDLEICWLKDPIDAFFIHIQGSVRVRLEDGKLHAAELSGARTAILTTRSGAG